MTQQIQKHEKPRATKIHPTEIIIALMDLVFGGVLASTIPQYFRHPDNLQNPYFWPMVLPLFLISAGLLGAGSLLLFRQRSLARAFQWLASAGALLIAVRFVITVLWPRSAEEVLRILYAMWREILMVLGAILSPIVLRDLARKTED